MRAGGALGKDALALELKRLDATFLFGIRRVVAAQDGLGAGGRRSAILRGLLRLLILLLTFDGLAFPSTRHGSILLPIDAMHVKILEDVP